MLQQTHTVSNNGLQSFAEASPDYEMAPIGIGSMREQAKKLAEYGRNGDIYVVHAAEGETVIPLEVLESNPKIKELLFGQMRDMGLDPQEFVVGSELNSINPDTGLPEFFFKSVFRGVKKAVKSVAKIAKKVAPIAIPVAAAAFGIPFLGPAFGAGTFGASFLGGGIGSLVGGGDLKDAFKEGIISGGIASLSAGVLGAFSDAPGSSFMGGVKSSFTGQTPIYNVVGGKLKQAGTKYAASPLADVFGTSSAAKASAAASKAQFNNLFGSGSAIDTLTGEGAPFGKTATDVVDASGNLKPGYTKEGFGDVLEGGFIPRTRTVPQTLTLSEKVKQLSPMAESIYEVPGTGGKVLLGNVAETAAQEAAEKAVAQKYGMTVSQALKSPRAGEVIAAGKDAIASTIPGPAQKYLPTAGLGLGLTAALGGFDTPKVKDVTMANRVLDGGPTGSDIFQADPSAFKVAGINPTFFTPSVNPAVSTAYPLFSADGGPVNKPQDMSTGGTPEFPRRELLVEGPGTETSDDIPAMLSDGEFVLTAKAVRGADPSGKGNRQAGAKNLYDMMRNFEMRA